MTLDAFGAAWDRPRADLELLVELVEESEPSLSPEAILGPLPVGLVHAASVALVAEPPLGFQPLGPKSAWSASGRDLAVRVTGEPDELVAALARYAGLARRVRARLESAPELATRLRDGALEPADRPELAARLELDARALDRLERAGGLVDLGWMAARAFEAPVRIAPELRPRAAREAGRRAGARLAARLPSDSVSVLVLEDPVGLELFSPYVRDLGHALHAWGLENPERLRTARLAEALRSVAREPDDDLSALVAADLLVAEPEAGLLEERRAAERGAGLELEDGPGFVLGLARLDALGAPDPVLEGCSGLLAVIAGPRRDALVGAVAALLESGRAGGMGLVARLALEGHRAVIPEALATPHDGFAFPGARGLVERAEGLGIDASEIGLLELAAGARSGVWLAECVALARRELVRGSVPAELPVYGMFHPYDPSIPTPPLETRRSALEAARVVASVLVGETTSDSDFAQVRVNTGKNRPSNRSFRA